ncbi:ABC transporter substrate-binding protein [Rhodobacteraceae bacterium 63075]|nr:ABC transporter substrate-binding protein [Rhodobacteraceae bacterium 63075]
MSGFVRIFEHIKTLAARVLVTSAALLCAVPAAQAGAPERVVSMNLCTDQLAMMLAAEGQLLSVSRIALDPHVSPMAEAARDYHINSGQAEEIYLMQPDLVLAGDYTPQTTLDMLRGLGIRVEVFGITSSLDGVTTQLAKMGRALHRTSRAKAMIADFEARRAALAADRGKRPSALLYYANGHTSGEGSLAHDILELAGFRNAAQEAGYHFGRKMPLEVLALTDPDLVITSTPYPGGSRAEAVMAHPAVKALKEGRTSTAVTDHDWVCGTPRVLDAAARLAEVRREMTGAQP